MIRSEFNTIPQKNLIQLVWIRNLISKNTASQTQSKQLDRTLINLSLEQWFIQIYSVFTSITVIIKGQNTFSRKFLVILCEEACKLGSISSISEMSKLNFLLYIAIVPFYYNQVLATGFESSNNASDIQLREYRSHISIPRYFLKTFF